MDQGLSFDLIPPVTHPFLHLPDVIDNIIANIIGFIKAIPIRIIFHIGIDIIGPRTDVSGYRVIYIIHKRFRILGYRIIVTIQSDVIRKTTLHL